MHCTARCYLNMVSRRLSTDVAIRILTQLQPTALILVSNDGNLHSPSTELIDLFGAGSQILTYTTWGRCLGACVSFSPDKGHESKAPQCSRCVSAAAPVVCVPLLLLCLPLIPLCVCPTAPVVSPADPAVCVSNCSSCVSR